MLLINKKGFAKISCNKRLNTIKAGFSPTVLTANFNNLVDIQNNKISPTWLVECDKPELYNIKVSDDNKYLSISTDYDLAGDIVRVTLVDEEQNYVMDTIELKVFVI